MLFLLLFFIVFYLVLLVRSGDIECNPGPIKHNFKMFYCNVRGLKANLDDLSVASANFDMICCTETLVFVLDISRRHSFPNLTVPSYSVEMRLNRVEVSASMSILVFQLAGCLNMNAIIMRS